MPILREQAEDPDDENTLATALIRVGIDKVDWQVHERADTSSRYRLTDTRLVQFSDDEHLSTAN
ncbi:hypothetical protein [Mesorhizobium marinum]|uniref:hypothetical protein n=1 Tax=Mesorhizobium marinum TaxID=3228790 RepID=UPI003F5BC776